MNEMPKVAIDTTKLAPAVVKLSNIANEFNSSLSALTDEEYASIDEIHSYLAAVANFANLMASDYKTNSPDVLIKRCSDLLEYINDAKKYIQEKQINFENKAFTTQLDAAAQAYQDVLDTVKNLVQQKISTPPKAIEKPKSVIPQQELERQARSVAEVERIQAEYIRLKQELENAVRTASESIKNDLKKLEKEVASFIKSKNVNLGNYEDIETNLRKLNIKIEDYKKRYGPRDMVAIEEERKKLLIPLKEKVKGLSSTKQTEMTNIVAANDYDRFKIFVDQTASSGGHDTENEIFGKIDKLEKLEKLLLAKLKNPKNDQDQAFAEKAFEYLVSKQVNFLYKHSKFEALFNCLNRYLTRDIPVINIALQKALSTQKIELHTALKNEHDKLVNNLNAVLASPKPLTGEEAQNMKNARISIRMHIGQLDYLLQTVNQISKEIQPRLYNPKNM